MKVNEFYRHKWNKYVVKVTKVSLHNVELKTVYSGVTEAIAVENFDLNYEPCETIYKWRETIDELFSFAKIKFMGNSIRIDADDSQIEFSIEDDMLAVQFTDDIKEAVESDTNLLRFLLEDADEVILMFANLFE